MNYTIEYYDYTEKSASEGADEVRQIMKDVYRENPSHWPYGLSLEHHNGGVYMIREASTKDPVGFVGWQVVPEGMRKIGYYSIGLKKEARGKGFAKEAVAKVVQAKSAQVHEVRALIAHTNTASKHLANALGIAIEEV